MSDTGGKQTMTRYVSERVITREAVLFDGTEESWQRIRDLEWDDCYVDNWPEHSISYYKVPTVVNPGEWVTTDESGHAFVVDSSLVKEAVSDENQVSLPGVR